MRTFRAYQRSVLYDEAAKRSVSWKVVADLVKTGEPVRIRDAYSGEDVTAAAVAKIKAELERARAAAAAREKKTPEHFAQVLANPPLRVGVSSLADAERLADLAETPVLLEISPRARQVR